MKRNVFCQYVKKKPTRHRTRSHHNPSIKYIYIYYVSCAKLVDATTVNPIPHSNEKQNLEKSDFYRTKDNAFKT